MRPRDGLGGLTVAAILVAAFPVAGAHCSPPCGPVPPVIEIALDRTRDLLFETATTVALHGNVSYFVDVDFNGYYADPQRNPTLTLVITRVPAWMAARVEPSTFTVPLNDPSYLRAAGADQVDFYWSEEVLVTVERLRDPTAEELAPTSKEVRRDGSARVLIIGTSTPTYLAQDLLGPQLGIQEGYGARELRFVPEKDGIPYLLDEKGVLRPGGVAPLGAKASPGVGVAAILTLALAPVLRRR